MSQVQHKFLFLCMLWNRTPINIVLNAQRDTGKCSSFGFPGKGANPYWWAQHISITFCHNTLIHLFITTTFRVGMIINPAYRQVS